LKIGLPVLLFLTGVTFIVLAYFLQGKTNDDRAVVSNFVAMFMLLSGLISVVVGALKFFLRNEDEDI
jgi:hypothetical protein